MKNENERKKNTSKKRNRKGTCIVLAIAMVVTILAGCGSSKTDDEASVTITAETESSIQMETETTEETAAQTETETIETVEETTENDSQTTVDDGTQDIAQAQTTGQSASVSDIESADTTQSPEKTYGIDVSMYQGVIDWEKVAASGIDFAIIRVGYRNNSGEIIEDDTAKYNMQEASKNGIQIGAYFFSRATTSDEAVEEAQFVISELADYPITYPVVYNCEGYDSQQSRQYGISASDRTSFASQFLDTISAGGYSPMFYASSSELESGDWDTSTLSQNYKIWMAQYPETQTDTPSYSGSYDMWQYTNQGTVDGISQKADIDIANFGYTQTGTAQNQDAVLDATADVEVLMNFQEVDETVTAKSVVNLRDKPSQGDESSVVTQLSNGDTASRTAVSDTGWSRLVYNGTTCYAVSSYLTTDLSYTAASSQQSETTDSGFETQFTDCNDTMTAKISTNLRNMPSVTNADSTIVATINNGDVVTRTGVNEEQGWSRVVYNDQTLYCVTSYLTPVQ